MRKILLVLAALVVAFNLNAQTPQYLSVFGDQNNVFPFRDNNTNKVQWIYHASDFTPLLPAGAISKLYVKVHTSWGTAGLATYTNLIIRMGHTTNANTVTGPWLTGMQDVYIAPSVSFNIVLGGWVEIPLQTPFVYNGVNNLVIEASQTSFTNGFYITQSTLGGNRRMWGPVSGTAASGSGAGLMHAGLDMGPTNCTGTPNAGNVLRNDTRTLICGDSATFRLNNATLATGVNYQWRYSTNNGITWINFGSNNDTATLTNMIGNRLVKCISTCTFSNQSAESPVFQVDVFSAPVSLGADTAICDNRSIQLSVASYNPSSVVWDNASTSNSRTITAPGTYFAVLNFANGCVSSDTIVIADGVEPTNPLPSSINLCEDATVMLDAQNQGMKYLWNTNDTTRRITAAGGGNYQVDITSANYCVASFSTFINERPKPKFGVLNNLTICDGESVFVDATAANAVSYQWSNGPTNASQTLVDSGRYTVKATTSFGCQDSASFVLSFFPSPFTEGFSYIPGFFNDYKQVKFVAINPRHINTYLWDFGDGNTSTLASPLHQYDTFGDYQVILYVTNECNTRAYEQDIRVPYLTTSVDDLHSAHIKLYPNPSFGTLYIEGIAASGHQYRVIGITGQVLLQGDINNNSVDLKNLSGGNYIIELIAADKVYKREKIAIAH